MTAKHVMNRNFSRAAAKYDDYAHIQRECAEELGALSGGDFRNILEIGSGTGVYTRVLAEKYTSSGITAVDISKEMVKFAEKKFASDKNVKFLVADAEDSDFGRDKFDLITSNAAFQWFFDARGTLGKLAEALTDRGEIIFSIYGPATFWELGEVMKEHFGPSGRLAAASFMSGEKVREMLLPGFVVDHFSRREFKAEYNALYDLFSAIKSCGAGSTSTEAKASIKKADIKKMEELYKEKFGGITATHEVFFFRVVKKEKP